MKKLILIFILFSPLVFFAQEEATTFGLQFKPIIPSNVFRAGDYNLVSERSNLQYTISQEIGYSLGMIIRKGVSKNWSFESGIMYTKRNYSFAVVNSDNDDNFKNNFSVIGYEIPALALLNVRLDKRLYMNTAFGPSIDMFPSNVATYSELFREYSIRKRWIQLSLVANLGLEYRTDKNGTIYIGGSLHRPFTAIYDTRLSYVYKHDTDGYIDEPVGQLSGNYLTVDVRYIFHEDPVKKSRKK